MRISCQLVPFALALCTGGLVSGCYLFHGSGGAELDAGRRPTVDAGRPAVLDSGRFDAGSLPICPPIGIDFACTDTETGFIPVGVPYDLPVVAAYFEGCFCGGPLACTATVEGPGRLAIDAVMCVELDCDGCFPYVRGQCRLPPLSEGTWRVSINGLDSMDLQVSDATPGVGPVDRCMTVAGPGPICEVQWRPEPERVDQICVPREATPGVPIPIETTNFCFPCPFAQGSCDTVRTANDIVVRPTVLPPLCDIACPPSCEERESHCFIPPLEPGDYTVHIEGLPGVAALTVGDSPRPGGARSCLSVPED